MTDLVGAVDKPEEVEEGEVVDNNVSKILATEESFGTQKKRNALDNPASVPASKKLHLAFPHESIVEEEKTDHNNTPNSSSRTKPALTSRWNDEDEDDEDEIIVPKTDIPTPGINRLAPPPRPKGHKLTPSSDDETPRSLPAAPSVDNLIPAGLRKNNSTEGPIGIEEEQEQEQISLVPNWACRSVERFERLSRVEEGTYGVVYKARDTKTNEVVALKKIKMAREREGFPITSLREIRTLMSCRHENVVDVREIAVGQKMDSIFMVMEFVEYDLRRLMENMKRDQKNFMASEVKSLMYQLLLAVKHMHENWVLHRDLKASNLLMTPEGVLKVADFGMAREFGDPLKKYTPLVVTLWYRAPELLLGGTEYSTAVDMWSVGCIFAELLNKEALFRGRTELDQIKKIFKLLGTPNERIWEGYSTLPGVKTAHFKEIPYSSLRQYLPMHITQSCFDLCNRLLTYDPKKRLSAADALRHPYFEESPQPKPPRIYSGANLMVEDGL
eukprot:GCRY01001642.1.p1 GENE.GCRY01001642.1~~GCRY01001642.1.p1  ORF type:complete len:500 (+),score=50.95 GCRY01001642.1:190-1689(+)